MTGIARRRWALGAVTFALMAGALATTTPALGASPPSATTGAATALQYSSATVAGTVNPNGSATTYSFEYGTTSGYGMQTSAASAGSGSSAVSVQQTLTGLSASTTYHYRLVAAGGSTVDGTDATFTTPKTPAPAVATGTATAVSNTAATVNGTVNPESVPTTYYFEYGTTTGYGTKTGSQSAGSGSATVNATDALSGLAASTAYHYRLVATSAGGTVVGSDRTFATAKTPAPAASTSAATAIASHTATLNGTVNPEGVATSDYFQYGTTTAYSSKTTAQPAGSGTAVLAARANIAGLASGTTYHYRLVATSAGGTVTGSDRTFATSKLTAPVATTGVATTVTTTSAVLTGTVNPEATATSYYFQYGLKTLTTHTPTVSAGAGAATIAASTALSGLAPGTSYVYRLVAVGASTTVGATRSFTTGKVPLALALNAAANPVAAGASVTFAGTLSGTGAGIRTVALQVDPYPYTGDFTQLGADQQTTSTGAFSFTLPRVAANTHVRAVTVGGSPALASAVITEQAFVVVRMHVHRNGRAARFSGWLSPSGTPVRIQIQRRLRGRWVTIVRTGTSPSSGGRATFAYTIRRPHSGRYRIVAHVTDGSLLSAHTRVITLK